MGTLNERLWAVLSERGREAAGLTYEEAAGLVRELRAGAGANGGKMSGLCIVTTRAGERVAPAKKDSTKKKSDGKTKRTRRATK
ncbi:MAG TPA: hypothetical protein VKB12_18335 [Pyrinomonadaceae bacterium]|nr:hypothetical protein [Pyrinomonadaceae bacterium]